jgi:N-ethylmaleimide reductase
MNPSSLLFQSAQLGDLTLKNRIVMAPMTRSRAVHANTPNALMVDYYQQRASAGLIISEGVSPSPNGLGYPRMPGLFNQAHVAGWRAITDAVHARGGKIIVQLMHSGPVSHVDNLPDGAEVVGPGVTPVPGLIRTESGGMQPVSAPRAMTLADIRTAILEFAHAAKLSVEAGFDGVELHAGGGYLLESFFNAHTNQRCDEFGGDPGARNRFIIEVAKAVAEVVGAKRVGIRFVPHAGANGALPYEDMDAQFIDVAKKLSAMGLMHLHMGDYSSMGMPPLPAALREGMRQAFEGPFIFAGGFDHVGAVNALEAEVADLIAFGRSFIANPDLVERLQASASLNAPDFSTFYSPGPQGYTDYPSLHQQTTLME